MKKRILSLLLTLVMVVSLIPTTVWADDSVQVTFSAQKEGAFLFTRQSVTVTDGLAEEYGYEVSTQDHNNVAVEDPTVFDAMVAVHKAKYGDAFTKETAKNYLDISKGTLRKAFGESATASSFFVNGEMPSDENKMGYVADTSRLKAGDLVEFWFYQDTSYWSDYYTYFTETTKTVPAGEPFALKLMGFMAMGAMYGMSVTPSPIVGTNEETYITISTVNSDGSLSGALTDYIGNALTTNANGEVTLSFAEPGTYIVTASGMAADSFMGSCPIVAPWCAVTVTGGGTPVQQDTLTSLKLYKANNDSSLLTLTPEFSADTKTYTVSVFDQDGANLYVTAVPSSEKTVTAKWTNLYSNKEGTATVSATSRTTLVNCIKKGTTGNTVTLSVGDNEDAYTVNVVRTPTLQSLAIDGVRFNEQFAYGTNHYTAATSAETVYLMAKGYSDDYKITFNGSENQMIPLAPGENTVAVKVTNADGTLVNTYTVIINRKSTVKVTFTVNPTDAAVLVRDHFDAAVAPDADGSYSLLSGETYSYAVTRSGYVSKYQGNYVVPTDDENISVTLTAAPASSLTDVGAAWKNFRNSDFNMAITSARTPKAPETTALKWTAKLGSGYTAAPSVQIIVDNSLIVMSGKNLYKLDLAKGETKATATMVNSPSYGYTPPTYAKGMIFCPLNGGIIQAFDAKTLESLWVYRDPGKGQALSPITYSDGYIYTGFWNNETKSDSYVCLSVTDEDPNETTETKYATWTKSVPGGFYWAGSVVVDDVLVVGTDDGAGGTTGTSRLYALNKKNGSEINHLDLTGLGDQRSSIAYSAGRVYFTTKGGYLCSAAVSSSDGKLSDLKWKKVSDQSTSTPIVYKDYVYFCAGSGVIEGASGSGYFVVADANTLEIVRAVEMKGYPQCSPLLSTAYEDEGYLYFYCTYNKTPGGISLIKVKTADQSAERVELYTPEAGLQNYCITSIICDTDGTLYYKNDSGYVFAVGVSTDAQKAQQVQDQIAAIGTVVTLDSESAIKAARTAYDALTDAQKKLVNNLSVLTDAEEKLAQLKKEKADQDAADAVIVKIQAVETAVASGDKAAIRSAIRAARAAYNSLTSAQKKLVTNYSVLTEAEKAYPGTSNSTKPGSTGGSSKPADSTVKSSDTGDSSQMTLWLGGVLLSAAALTVLTRKRKRS